MGSILQTTLNTRALPTGNFRYIRSDYPGKLTDGEVQWLRLNGITTIVDLREEKEYAARPCRLENENGFIYHHLPVTGGGDTPKSPEAVAETYLGMIDAQMDKIINTIMNAESNVMYFCGAGKDRTGVVSAIILRKLGYSDRVIIDDYMETKDNLMGFLTSYVKEHPEVDINIIIPNENNIRKVLSMLDKPRASMNLQDCYIEEDLFPKIFTDYEEREYGILFYNTDNKDSYDSNHAVIYKDKIRDLQKVLSDITDFYKKKGSRPIIYQSMLDDNWFGEIQKELGEAGFKSWIEDQEYMLRSDENRITPDPDIMVRKESEWSDGIENVFMEAEEPWEIKVAKKTLDYPGAWMFAAYLNGKAVGLLYGHISDRACRVDYLIVSKKHRQKGVGRALFYNYVEWCRQNNIDNVYIWPDGETPKRIYEEGGYRVSEIRKAGRAVIRE